MNDLCDLASYLQMLVEGFANNWSLLVEAFIPVRFTAPQHFFTRAHLISRNARDSVVHHPIVSSLSYRQLAVR